MFTISSLAVALHRRDVIQAALVGAVSIAYLIYVPAAVGLCLAKKATRFDHVAGEVAYLLVQIGGYLGESDAFMLELDKILVTIVIAPFSVGY